MSGRPGETHPRQDTRTRSRTKEGGETLSKSRIRANRLGKQNDQLSRGGTVRFREQDWDQSLCPLLSKLKRKDQFFGVSPFVTLILSIVHGGFLDWTSQMNS